MNDVSTRERVGREAPLTKVTDWNAFFQPFWTKVEQDAKQGVTIHDVLGKELNLNISVSIEEATFEAEKRGWRTVHQKDRLLWVNEAHIASKVPGCIFRSRNDFITLKVKELKNICRILGVSPKGNQFALMTTIADCLSLPMDEVALPAEEPTVIEEPAEDPKPVGIQVITAPPPSLELTAVMLTVPYGRARPLYRKDRFADNRYGGWELVKGRTLENVTNMLLKMGTFKVSHGPGPHTDGEGKRWKCIVLAHSPRAI